ncbi:MAG: hypothetical protein V4760_10920 [Bdellovibrionota bacterium]
MKKLANLFVVIAMLSAPALAATKKKSGTKVPTALPAYKGKTKVSIDFQSSNDPNGVVLVAESIAKENADARQLRGETKTESNRDTKVVKAAPAPVVNDAPAVLVETTTQVTVTTPPPTAAPAPSRESVEKSSATLPTKLPSKSTVTAKPTETVVVETKTDIRKRETSDVAPAKSTTPSVSIPTVSEKIETPANSSTTVDSTTTVSSTQSEPAMKHAPDFEDRTGAVITTSQVQVTTTTTISRRGGRTFLFEAGYLDSRYDKLQSDLKNGASTMSVSLGLPVVDDVEVRAAFDIAHGLDQSVTPQNTRMLAARGGALARIGTVGRMNVSAGGTIGIAGVDVRSYRGVTATEFTIKQHAMGTALILVPEIASRVELGQQVLLQVALRYVLLSGQDELRKLGGLAASAGVGYEF